MTDSTTTTATTTAATTTTATSWLEGKPVEFIGTLENRGVKDKTADEVAIHFWEAHRNATQALSKFGATDPNRILVRPQNESDESQWNDFYGKVRPSKWEDYGITGDDAKEFGETAFDLGLSKGQAAKLRAWMNEGVAAETKAASDKTAELKEALRREDSQLRINWGSHYDDNLSLAISGLKQQYGMTEEQIAGLKNNPGFARALEGGLRYAQALGEDKFTSGAGGQGPRSYEQAKASLDDFMRNPRGPDAIAYMDQNNPRHKEVRAEVTRIQRIVADYESRQKQDWSIAA